MRNQNEIGLLPPQDIKIENAVIGGLISESSEYKYIQELFHEELFFNEDNRIIARAIISLNNESKVADITGILNWLKSNVQNNHITFYELSVLTNNCLLSGFMEKILMLSEFYIKRKIIVKNSELIKMAYDPTQDVFELLGEQEKITNEIISKISISKTATALDCAIELDNHLAVISKLKEGKIIGIDTGFNDLNNITSGWQNTDLIILAARPSMGKTSLALNLAKSALNDNEPLLIFSLEMSKMSLYARMCSQETSIPLNKFLKTPMTENDMDIYKKETYNLAQSKMYIEDKGGVDVNFIKIKSRKIKRDHGIKMIIIDYLGLIHKGNSNKSTNDQVGEISSALKSLAKELEIPIIVLCQLSREVEKTPDKRPSLSHLRDSGNIEQDADQVLFIYRPEYYGITDDGEGNSTIGKAEIIMAKNRNGALDSVIVNFDGTCTNFYDYKKPKEIEKKYMLENNNDFLAGNY